MNETEWQKAICAAAKTDTIDSVAKIIDGVKMPLLGNPKAKPAPRFINTRQTELLETCPLPLSDKTSPSDELADAFQLMNTENEKAIALKVNPHLFISIAKIRAARWIATAQQNKEIKIYTCAPLPAPEAAAKKLEEENWNYMLVSLASCFSAICGGADYITLSPHSEHNPHAKRLLRNVWLIAQKEGLLSRTLDPAAGSGLIETLTRQFAEEAWAKLGKTAPLPEDAPPLPEPRTTKTSEQIEVKNYYTPKDLPPEQQENIMSLSGAPPFMRGPYAAMFLTRPWTIRQYAGFSTAEESNDFYHHALDNGQKGLSVAFDLPTHRGFDSDNKSVASDVGMAGVAIDCLEDMRILFDKIPLDEVSVSMTMNGAVLPIMALYIAAAAEQKVPPEKLAGTIQNDVLKEFMVRNTYIYPPKESMRIVADIFTYASKHMPKFNTISISGYHMQEAGASKDLELAYTLADGIEYVRAGLKAGMDIDEFAPRLSFFWCIGMDFFMEIAKMRAARVLWADIMKGFGAKNQKSMALRTHCQTSGWSLTANDVFNNVTRTCLEAMAAVSGGTQSLHTNALDEAMALPSRFSAKLARETQLFLQNDTDLCATIDGWGGSYYVERLTLDMIKRARTLIDEIEAEGGMVEALAKGLPKKRIEEAATYTQAKIDSGEHIIVGVNSYQVEDEPEINILKIDNMAVRENQVKRLRLAKAQRDENKTKTLLDKITEAAKKEASSQDSKSGEANLLAACVEAAKAGASVGEMSLAMEKVFTRYKAKPEMIRGVYGTASEGNARLQRARKISAEFEQRRGFRPHILIAKAGQDGHDRGQKVVAAAYADMGFDVSLGALFQTARDVAEQAIEANAHIVAISSLAGAHLPLAQELVKALNKAERGDVLVVVGGVIPNDDIPHLKDAGVDAVFPPGTDVSASAIDLLELLRGRN